MTSEEAKGFTISPARTGFVLSLLGMVTFGWTIIGYVKVQEFQIGVHSDYIAEDKTVTKEILGELKIITRKVDELSFMVRSSDLNRSTASAPDAQ